MVLINAGGNKPAQQVQSDWSETDASDPSYIQNKPTILNGFSYAGLNNITVTSEIASNGYLLVSVSLSSYGGADNDYLVFCTATTNHNVALVSYESIGLAEARVIVKNCGTTAISVNTVAGVMTVYKRPKEANGNRIFVIGTVARNAVRPPELPTLGTAGQVLSVNSGATGVEWATPSSGFGYTFYEVI